MNNKKFIKNLSVFCMIVIISCTSAVNAATGHFFNGALKTGQFWGVKGNIECDPVVSTNDASAWMMLVGGNTYIQVGWGTRGLADQGVNYHFWEVGNASTSSINGQQIVAVAPTGTHSYEISESNSVWLVKVNGSVVGACLVSSLGMTPDHAEFFGEVHDSVYDQSPGTTVDPITMGYLKVRNSSGTWSNATFTNAGISSLSHQYNNSSVGSYSFEQWDSRY